MGTAPDRARGKARGRAIWLAVLAVVAVVAVVAGVTWLGGPPRPTRTLVPEVVGIVVREDFLTDGCQMMRVTLESGTALDLRLLGDGQARCGDGPWVTGVPSLTRSTFSGGVARVGDPVPDGGLLYYGRDGTDEWIAGAYASPSSPDCPYRLSGQGYDEGAVLHFSSGLVVQKAPGYANRKPWVKDANTVFRDADVICVNRQGEAIAIDPWVYF